MALVTNTLKALRLHNTCIGDSGVTGLSRVLAANRTLAPLILPHDTTSDAARGMLDRHTWPGIHIIWNNVAEEVADHPP